MHQVILKYRKRSGGGDHRSGGGQTYFRTGSGGRSSGVPVPGNPDIAAERDNGLSLEMLSRP